MNSFFKLLHLTSACGWEIWTAAKGRRSLSLLARALDPLTAQGIVQEVKKGKTVYFPKKNNNIQNLVLDEAALKDMIDKTQDAEFLSQYPLLNKMLSQNRTKEESDQAKEAMVKMLSGCKGMEDYAVFIRE